MKGKKKNLYFRLGMTNILVIGIVANNKNKLTNPKNWRPTVWHYINAFSEIF